MALIKIESCEVLRPVGTRGAFAVGEYITLPTGASFQKTYTVWAQGEAPLTGTIVSVVGQLGMKIREYPAPSGMKHAIDVSINEPEVTVLAAPKPDTIEETAAAIQDIAASTGNEIPF
jgi:hypothetical protein